MNCISFIDLPLPFSTMPHSSGVEIDFDTAIKGDSSLRIFPVLNQRSSTFVRWRCYQLFFRGQIIFSATQLSDIVGVVQRWYFNITMPVKNKEQAGERDGLLRSIIILISCYISRGMTLCTGATWMTSHPSSTPLLPALTPVNPCYLTPLLVLKVIMREKAQQFLGGNQG